MISTKSLANAFTGFAILLSAVLFLWLFPCYQMAWSSTGITIIMLAGLILSGLEVKVILGIIRALRLGNSPPNSNVVVFYCSTVICVLAALATSALSILFFPGSDNGGCVDDGGLCGLIWVLWILVMIFACPLVVMAIFRICLVVQLVRLSKQQRNNNFIPLEESISSSESAPPQYHPAPAYMPVYLPQHPNTTPGETPAGYPASYPVPAHPSVYHPQQMPAYMMQPAYPYSHMYFQPPAPVSANAPAYAQTTADSAPPAAKLEAPQSA